MLFNISSNSTVDCWKLLDYQVFNSYQFYLSALTLLFLNSVVIIGNAVVITAVLSTKRLRMISDNYFLISLAFSDLALGVLVLPFSTAYQTLNVWLFGPSYCRFWLSLDIWLCTASIYNLVAIAADRYLAVAKPLTYKLIVSDGRKTVLIFAAWGLSFLIGCPSVVFLWPPAYEQSSKRCSCTQMTYHVGFTLFSASASFYVPILVIFSLYFKMYRIIRRVGGSNRKGFIECDGPSITIDHCATVYPSAGDDDLTGAGRGSGGGRNSVYTAETQCLRVHKGKYNMRGSIAANSMNSLNPIPEELDIDRRLSAVGHWRRRSFSWSNGSVAVKTPETRRKSLLPVPQSLTNFTKRCELKMGQYHKRLAVEMRALKTVGLVTGCFFVCWAGFCVVYTSQVFPSCRDQNCLPDVFVSVSVWLGYANSALNPFIYVVCSRQYRTAMIRLFRCKCFC